jgi:hypothetical protein
VQGKKQGKKVGKEALAIFSTSSMVIASVDGWVVWVGGEESRK